jgi:hypothetical protein
VTPPIDARALASRAGRTVLACATVVGFAAAARAASAEDFEPRVHGVGQAARAERSAAPCRPRRGDLRVTSQVVVARDLTACVRGSHRRYPLVVGRTAAGANELEGDMRQVAIAGHVVASHYATCVRSDEAACVGSTTVLDLRRGRWVGRVQLVWARSTPIDSLVVARDGRAAWAQTAYALDPVNRPGSVYALGPGGAISTLASGLGVETLSLRIHRPTGPGAPATVSWREDGVPRAATLADPPRPAVPGAGAVVRGRTTAPRRPHPAFARSSSIVRSSMRRILPVSVLGRSSTNSTSRG